MRFALAPDRREAVPAGQIARGAAAGALITRLAARRGHYDRLLLARGAGWCALFDPAVGEPATLPWLAERPIYLYALTGGVLCQTGFRPDMPAALYPQMATRHRRMTGGDMVALTAEGGGRLYDLGRAVRVADADVAALAAEGP